MVAVQRVGGPHALQVPGQGLPAAPMTLASGAMTWRILHRAATWVRLVPIWATNSSMLLGVPRLDDGPKAPS